MKQEEERVIITYPAPRVATSAPSGTFKVGDIVWALPLLAVESADGSSLAVVILRKKEKKVLVVVIVAGLLLLPRGGVENLIENREG